MPMGTVVNNCIMTMLPIFHGDVKTCSGSVTMCILPCIQHTYYV